MITDIKKCRFKIKIKIKMCLCKIKVARLQQINATKRDGSCEREGARRV